MKIREILILGIKTLKNNNIEDYSLIARELLAFILKKDKHYLIVNSDIEISDILVNKYDKYLNEIIEGKPLQYITNKQEFMKLDFYVDESVLIPQPDTEILVEEVLKLCNEKDEIKILDLCTGSGAVAVSLGKYIKIKDKIIFASDISKNALKIAKKNAKNNNTKINFIQSDMFKCIAEKDFYVIVSNPPYIEKSKISTLSKQVLCEPKLALDGGEDGLDFYRVIAENAYKYLNKNGYLALEIGYNQKNNVIKILEKNNKYDIVKTVKDLANNDRCIIARIKKLL